MNNIIKKLTGVGVIIAVGAAIYVVFTAPLWRGLKPAILPPPQNIADIIQEQKKEAPAENKTGLPLKLPDGFSISIFAQGLGAPRVMAWGPDGRMLVSIPAEGKVVALRDANGDGIAEETETILSGLNHPHGLASRCDAAQCTLYVAESDKVMAYTYHNGIFDAAHGKKIAALPDGGRHFTRTIMFMPSPSKVLSEKTLAGKPHENTLLISVGSSCDVCNESNTLRAKILALDVTTRKLEEYAKGLRNAVFMAIHPVTGAVWATEMGRDMLGDDIPPDEINVIEQGKNYGWPICYGKNVHDTVFDTNTYVRNPCMAPFETPSAIDIPAHSAPLGLAFFPEEGWPQEFWHNLLVAYHGSWNRSEPTGYKIVRYKLDEKGNYIGEEDFISGWLENGRALGRPVDILIQPGGTIYVSDDKAGVIYHVMYRAQEKATDAQAKTDLIRVSLPKEGALVESPLTVQGEARGNWFFEASFPVMLLDDNGKEIARGIAQAQKDWMTADFVPFSATLTFARPATEKGMLVLEKDNPSGLPEHADELRIPVRFGE